MFKLQINSNTNRCLKQNTVNSFITEAVMIFSVPTDVINLCGKIRIRKSRHYGGQTMKTNGAILSNGKSRQLFYIVR